MADLASQAKPEIEKLMQSDVNQLYEELGIRMKAYGNDLNVATSFAPQVGYSTDVMGPLEDLRLFGKEFFQRVNRQAYELVCGNALTDQKDRAKLAEAFKIGRTELAAYLAVLLVGYFGLAAGAAAVVAALIIKLFFKPGQEAMCVVWATKLPKATRPKAETAKPRDKKKKR